MANFIGKDSLLNLSKIIEAENVKKALVFRGKKSYDFYKDLVRFTILDTEDCENRPQKQPAGKTQSTTLAGGALCFGMDYRVVLMPAFLSSMSHAPSMYMMPRARSYRP